VVSWGRRCSYGVQAGWVLALPHLSGLAPMLGRPWRLPLTTADGALSSTVNQSMKGQSRSPAHLAATSDLCSLCWDLPAEDGSHDAIWRHWCPEAACDRLNEKTAGEAAVWHRHRHDAKALGIVDARDVRSMMGSDGAGGSDSDDSASSSQLTPLGSLAVGAAAPSGPLRPNTYASGVTAVHSRRRLCTDGAGALPHLSPARNTPLEKDYSVK
jgi:hypothetical protein